MKLYPYWAVGEATVRDVKRPWKVRAYGGSSAGMEEAQRRARDAAERVAAAIARGNNVRGEYSYADRPMREEIVQEVRNGGELVAAITRNSYGALVLNTSRVMFADVDLFPSSAAFFGAGGATLGETFRELWDRLRGRPSSVRLAREAKIMGRVGDVVSSRPRIGVRIYRTAGGFRLLVTSNTFDPLAAETQQLLTAFGSDPLYVRLCKAQECFRARLSAKFWRCGAQRPPSRFPWADGAEETEYRQWEQDYHRLANHCATCRLVENLGESAVDDAVQPILEMHDRLTIQDGAPLA